MSPIRSLPCIPQNLKGKSHRVRTRIWVSLIKIPSLFLHSDPPWPGHFSAQITTVVRHWWLLPTPHRSLSLSACSFLLGLKWKSLFKTSFVFQRYKHVSLSELSSNITYNSDVYDPMFEPGNFLSCQTSTSIKTPSLLIGGEPIKKRITLYNNLVRFQLAIFIINRRQQINGI